MSWIAPRFYIPSRALALDPKDVIADEKDRFETLKFCDISRYDIVKQINNHEIKRTLFCYRSISIVVVFREGYATDPLIWHYQSKPGFTVAVFDAIDEAQKNLMNLKVKCLVQHGTEDLVCN